MRLRPYFSMMGCVFVSLGIVTTILGRLISSTTTSTVGIFEIGFGLCLIFLFFADRGVKNGNT